MRPETQKKIDKVNTLLEGGASRKEAFKQTGLAPATYRLASKTGYKTQVKVHKVVPVKTVKEKKQMFAVIITNDLRSVLESLK